VRHGQGEVNVSGRIGGPIGCSGLTETGRRQVAAMAHRLSASAELAGADALYASILPRAIETAAILAPALGQRADEVIEDCSLCELHPGEADDLIWEDYIERYEVPDWDADPSLPLAPGGEAWNGFVDRAADALEALAAAHPGQLVVVATHAGVIEAAVLRFVGASPPGGPHRRLRLQTAHASLSEFEASAGRWRLRRYNDAAVGI